jgi:hypothetical protein
MKKKYQKTTFQAEIFGDSVFFLKFCAWTSPNLSDGGVDKKRLLFSKSRERELGSTQKVHVGVRVHVFFG